jgi:CubicO group peptidase (beta-lactamase class C family)
MIFKTIKVFFQAFLFIAIFLPSITSQDLIVSDPSEVGMSADRLNRIESRMQDYVDMEMVSGTLALVARKGKVVHLSASGMANREEGTPMDEETIFRIFSMTKPITSVALMMLYEEGKFQLYDPVSKYIPEFADLKVFVSKESPMIVEDMKQPITIWNLLTHTAGFGYGWGPGSYVDTLYQQNMRSMYTNEGKTMDDFFSVVKEIPLYHQPGTAFRYGISTDMCGYLIEKLSGQKLGDFLQERIFDPLAMNSTAFYIEPADFSRFAMNYAPMETGGIGANEFPYEGAFMHKIDIHSGGGGLLSTIGDYYRFCQMLLNGGELEGIRILSPKTIELMTLDHVQNLPHGGGPVRMPNQGEGFGLGFSVVKNTPATRVMNSDGVYGWGGLAGTYFRIDPAEEMIQILMIQLIPNNHLSIQQDFRVLSYQAIVD